MSSRGGAAAGAGGVAGVKPPGGVRDEMSKGEGTSVRGVLKEQGRGRARGGGRTCTISGIVVESPWWCGSKSRNCGGSSSDAAWCTRSSSRGGTTCEKGRGEQAEGEAGEGRRMQRSEGAEGATATARGEAGRQCRERGGSGREIAREIAQLWKNAAATSPRT